MFAGIQTMFLPPDPNTRLGFIYETRPSLVSFGILFFSSGFVLFIGKIKKWKKVVGVGLMMIYLDYLFAAFLNWYAIGWSAAWGNFIGALLLGVLHLKWKRETYNPKPRKFLPEHVDTNSPVV